MNTIALGLKARPNSRTQEFCENVRWRSRRWSELGLRESCHTGWLYDFRHPPQQHAWVHPALRWRVSMLLSGLIEVAKQQIEVLGEDRDTGNQSMTSGALDSSDQVGDASPDLKKGVLQQPEAAMAVIFVNDHLAEGGAERSMAKIVSGLAGTDRFRITLALLENKRTFPVPDSVRVHAFHRRFATGPLGKFLSLATDAYRLSRLVRREQARAVCSFQHRANFVNVLAKRVFGGTHRCIVSERVHVREYYRHKSFAGISRGPVRDLLARLANAMVRALYRRADTVTCNAEDTRNCLVEDYGIPPEIVHVIPSGYDETSIRMQADEPILAEEQALFDGESETIITVGRLCRQKGHDYLLEAFARLQPRNRYRLVLLGNGPWRDRLEQLAKRLQIADRVHFLGYRENPCAYVARADCFAFPSRYEGFPNALAEAMICNVPVVAFDFRAGASELLENGRYGALVPLGDVDGLAAALAGHRQPSRRPLPSESSTTDHYAQLLLAAP